MRILHICQRDDPDIGGSLRVVEGLVREQQAAGLDVWLLFLYGGPAGITEEFSPNVIHLGIQSSKQALSGMRLLKKAVKRVEPDVVHSHDGILWPRIAYTSLTVPVVTHGHLPPPVSSGFKGRLAWPLIKKTSDAVIGISQHTMDTWIDAGFPAGRIHLVSNGVDFSRFPRVSSDEKKTLRGKLKLPADARIILWVGRLHQVMKGTDRVERVASELPEGVVLVVVGNGPDFDGMKKRMAKLIEEQRVIMAGSVSEPAIYYQAADSYLFTSYYEPFGLVILEAVASCLPILSFPVTRGGGATALLDEFDAVTVSDDSSSETFTTAIEQVLGRSEEAIVIRDKAEMTYSWHAAAKKLTEIYEKILADKGSGQ